jgi:hypothetical protein
MIKTKKKQIASIASSHASPTVSPRLLAVNNLCAGQNVWRETKERLYFGTIDSLKTDGIGDAYVNWEGIGVRPENPEFLLPSDCDSLVELIIDRFFANNPTDSFDPYTLSDILRIPVGGIEDPISLVEIEAVLDRLKEKGRLIFGGGLWCLSSPLPPPITQQQQSALERMAIRAAYSEQKDKIALSPKTYLTLDEIRLDGGTQARLGLNSLHVKLLTELLEEDDAIELDPIVIYHDGENYWLADGFHRFNAYRDRQKEVISCRIIKGTRREAVLFAVGANEEHKTALKRSNKDKQNAVRMLLEDPEWQNWSDAEIARICKVSQPMVSKLRKAVGKCGDGSRIFHGRAAGMPESNSGIAPSPREALLGVEVTYNVIGDTKIRTYKNKHGQEAIMTFFNFGDRVLHNNREAAVIKTGKKLFHIEYEDNNEQKEVLRKDLTLAPTHASSFQQWQEVDYFKKQFKYFYSIDSKHSVLFDPHMANGYHCFLAKTEELTPTPTPTKQRIGGVEGVLEEILKDTIVAVSSNLANFSIEQIVFLKEAIEAELGGRERSREAAEDRSRFE